MSADAIFCELLLDVVTTFTTSVAETRPAIEIVPSPSISNAPLFAAISPNTENEAFWLVDSLSIVTLSAKIPAGSLITNAVVFDCAPDDTRWYGTEPVPVYS